jgi:Winged helix DNA-binding domain
MIEAIAERRLLNQGIDRLRHRQAADVVEWLGAVQAQEYEPAKWALGLRMASAADADIERAFEQGRILRTHVMRPTWHFVTPIDIRWMLELTAPFVHRRMALYDRQLGLDAAIKRRSAAVMEQALGEGSFLTRVELGDRLKQAGFTINGTRLAHLALYAELEGVICSGPRRGRKFTYALIADRAPKARRLSRDEALAELSLRYFRSHGPATVRDFVWWSGLVTADAHRGIEMIRAKRQDIDGQIYWTAGPTARTTTASVKLAHLLPIYDEYVVSYRDRIAVPHGPAMIPSGTGRGYVTFQHALVIGGQIAGTWRISRSARGIAIAATALRRLSPRERRAVADAADRYARFLGVAVELVVK